MSVKAALLVVIVWAWNPALSGAQSVRSPLEGMWSNPPATAVGSLCAFYCTDAGIDRLNALMDDPANDARPFPQLQAQASAYQLENYIRPKPAGPQRLDAIEEERRERARQRSQGSQGNQGSQQK